MNKALVVSKSAQRRAEGLLVLIERKKGEAARAFYEIGAALDEIVSKKLYGVLAYASFEKLLDDREIMAASQAFKLIEVSRKFSRDQALRLGPEKAYALARYVARTRENDNPGELLAEGFPIGGRRRSLDDVTAGQIQEATRTAVRRQKGEHGASERAHRDAMSVERRVRAALRHRANADVTVGLSFHHGSWHIRVDVPAEIAGSVLKV